MVWPDSLASGRDAATRARLRQYKSLGEIAGSMPISLLLLPKDVKNPGHGLVTAVTETSSSEIAEDIPDDTTEFPSDSVGLPRRRLDRLGRDSAYMVSKDFHVAMALKRARVFNKDIQGIADTLIFRQVDSMLYMIRKPVVWSGERQVYGNLIEVHFNDSTVDRAHLPQSGVLAEHVAEDFYNQLSGSELTAYFINQQLKHLSVDGNVQTIFLPQEKDSTYNKLVSAESSYLTVDMDGKDMKHLKMWPEVTGSVIPLFEVKKTQQFLDGFRWLEALRPKRSWYGNTVRWLDDLGDVPDDLERYFNEAPIIRQAPRSPFEGMKKSAGGPSQSISM